MFIKKKKVKEPQYYMSKTNMRTYNYKVYNMSFMEKILYFTLGFIAGALIFYLFYGGIAKDSFGNPTKTTLIMNIIFLVSGGLIGGFTYVPIRREQIKNKRQNQLRNQFRDLLESLNVSFGAGKNVLESFKSARNDLANQYDEDAFILYELDVILSGIENNIDIEELLEDFGKRSGLLDIISFSNVFKVTFRKGGNIKESVKNSHEILSEKMLITEEIETMVTASKTEQKLMFFMPILLIGMFKIGSPDFADKFTSPAGLVSTTIGVILFVVSYFIAQKILDIKI